MNRPLKVALRLVTVTMAYNCIEAVVAIYAAFAARSIALLGFGLDSVIEVAAAASLLWRLRIEDRGADPESVERSERRVHRVVGTTFLLLALYVLGQSIAVLLGKTMPEESLLGIALATVSLVAMPLIAFFKFRAARAIGSRALQAEAKETLACAYLSFTLLLGLAANAVFGWRWADPVAALLMVPWLIREGTEGVRGDGCCEGACK